MATLGAECAVCDCLVVVVVLLLFFHLCAFHPYLKLTSWGKILENVPSGDACLLKFRADILRSSAGSDWKLAITCFLSSVYLVLYGLNICSFILDICDCFGITVHVKVLVLAMVLVTYFFVTDRSKHIKWTELFSNKWTQLHDALIG